MEETFSETLQTLTIASLIQEWNGAYTELALGTLSPAGFLDRLAKLKIRHAELRSRAILHKHEAGALDLRKRLDEFDSVYERDFLSDHVKILRSMTHRYPDNDGLNELHVSMAHRHRDVLEREERSKKQRRHGLSEYRDNLRKAIAEEEQTIADTTKHVEELRGKLAEIEAELTK
jgi:hypothetical protein